MHGNGFADWSTLGGDACIVGGVEEARHFDGGARFDNEDLRKLSAS